MCADPGPVMPTSRSPRAGTDRAAALAACVVLCVACPDAPRDPPPRKPPASAPAAQVPAPLPPHKVYPSASAAITALLQRTRPTVIGFGELHQKTGSAPVRSAISRFSRSMLEALTRQQPYKASDLVVETWVAAGACGKQEQRVARKVQQTTERPAETESEVVRLLKRAKARGVQPHILRVGCQEYEQLLDVQRGGKLDHEQLLHLITRHLRDRTLRVLRARQQQHSAKGGPAPLVVVYGGALHNDLFPMQELEMFSYAQQIKQATGDRYVELDLYVPEYVEADELLGKQAWFPLLKSHVRPDQVLLVERGSRSFILVLRRGQTQQ